MDDTDDKIRVSNQPVTSSQQVAHSSSVGSVQKEQAPISSDASVASELIKPSEPEPNLHEEVKKVGVEKVSDRLTLTEEHKALGIEHAKESTPVHTRPLGMVKLPMTEEEALKTIKTTSNTDSRHWLAVLIEKIYKAIKSLKAVG